VIPAAEQAITFDCRGDRLLGILHRPRLPASRGVVIVTGGPQYRNGSHRQFLLLSRDLAEAGVAVLRFDYRGMGDSDGAYAGFEGVDADISAAIDALCAEVDGLDEVTLWGLCDGASAISFYAPRDPRVRGVVLVNPWVRSDASLARAQIEAYYPGRLTSADFWARLLTGKVNVWRSGLEFLAKRREAEAQTAAPEDGALPARVARALRAFEGRVLLILSGNDLTAEEFKGAVLDSGDMAAWRQRPEVTVRTMEGANHTYSSRDWRRTLHRWTIEDLQEEDGARRAKAG
jgi:exosortase A-associated hydrolase 1